MSSIAKFLKDEEAATAVEYSVVLAAILLTAFAAISTFGGKTGDLWNSIVSGLLGHGM
jgi:Flp pilus assembly pilin Flp